MTRAFVLGNGVSRLSVNLYTLKDLGPVYGCNALYREFTPTALISTDKPISERIQQDGYSNSNRMYTRRPLPGYGALTIPHKWYGFSSGPIATALAAQDQHLAVYMIGFDMGPVDGDKFNNIYADTEFYKRSTARPTFTGNWVRQIIQVTKEFPKTMFFRVQGPTTSEVAELKNISNLTHMTMEDFLNRINNTKEL